VAQLFSLVGFALKKVIMSDNNNDRIPLFKTWNQWYAFVIVVLVVLILVFYFFTKRFS
jgi:hypothetical protein